jgi:hypothetical protein
LNALNASFTQPSSNIGLNVIFCTRSHSNHSHFANEFTCDHALFIKSSIFFNQEFRALDMSAGTLRNAIHTLSARVQKLSVINHATDFILNHMITREDMNALKYHTDFDIASCTDRDIRRNIHFSHAAVFLDSVSMNNNASINHFANQIILNQTSSRKILKESFKFDILPVNVVDCSDIRLKNFPPSHVILVNAFSTSQNHTTPDSTIFFASASVTQYIRASSARSGTHACVNCLSSDAYSWFAVRT